MTIDVWSGTTSLRSIKVVLVAVGNAATAEEGQRYMDAIRMNSRIDQDSMQPVQDTVFRKAERQVEYVQLEFVDDAKVHRCTDWDSLFLHRRICAVIGIVHCPANPDLDKAYEQFLAVKQRFPQAVQFRCFAFEPLDTQQDLVERKDLIMFPHSDKKHLHFYMSTVVLDMTVAICQNLMEGARTVSSMQEFPHTPLDRPLIQLDAGKRKRVLPGRLAKISADHWLLAGVVTEARDLYQAAIEATKSSGDFVWRGAALEGILACEPSASYEVSVARLEKAIRNYARKQDTQLLRIETYFRLARMAQQRRIHIDALGFLSRAYELCEALSPQDQITVAIEAAILSQQQGALRKFGLFVREAALLFSETYQWAHCLRLTQLAMPIYGLSGTGPVIPHGWITVQKALLEELVVSARGINDCRKACAYMAMLLQTVGPTLPGAEQRKLVADLSALALVAPANTIVNMDGIPIFTMFSLVPHSPSFQPHHRDTNTPRRSRHHSFEDVFLFRPGIQGVLADCNVPFETPCNELFHTEVTFKNPLSIELVLENVSLICTGVAYEAFPVLFRLPANSNGLAVRLAVLPQSCGTLQFEAVNVRLCNIDWAHLIRQGTCTSISVCKALPLVELKCKAEPSHLFFGQDVRLPVQVRNVSSIPINDLGTVLRSSVVPDDNNHPFPHVEFNEDHVNRQLPLEPGQSLDVEIALTRTFKSGIIHLSVSYAQDMSCDIYRSQKLDIPFEFRFGLTVRSMQIYPFAQQPGFVSGNSSRDMSSCLDASTFGPEDCMLVVEVVNSANSSFSVVLMDNGTSDTERICGIEELSTNRLIFPIRRKSFGPERDHLLSQLGSDPAQMGNPFCGSPVFTESKQVILDRIYLEWKVIRPTASTHGVILLPESMISPLHLRYLVPHPFVFQFMTMPKNALAGMSKAELSAPISPSLLCSKHRFCDTRCPTPAACSCYPIGDFGKIVISITNRSERPLTFDVSVRACVETTRGSFSEDVSDAMLWIGSLNQLLSNVQPGESDRFELNVCFLVAGRFMFHLLCKTSQDSGTVPLQYSCSSPLFIEASEVDNEGDRTTP
ncbi:Trafficking protein particle complex subunit 11 domain-containing protein [Plasmodiophora brassicae]